MEKISIGNPIEEIEYRLKNPLSHKPLIVGLIDNQIDVNAYYNTSIGIPNFTDLSSLKRNIKSKGTVNRSFREALRMRFLLNTYTSDAEDRFVNPDIFQIGSGSLDIDDYYKNNDPFYSNLPEETLLLKDTILNQE